MPDCLAFNGALWVGEGRGIGGGMLLDERSEDRAGCGMWLTGRSLHLKAQIERILMLKLIWQVPEPKAIAVR